MQGGLALGLTTAQWGQTTISNGQASPLNFDRYRMLKMREMPKVTVAIVPSPAGTQIGGIGETMVPPTAPALANAYAKLTGVRKRSLPLFHRSSRLWRVGSSIYDADCGRHLAPIHRRTHRCRSRMHCLTTLNKERAVVRFIEPQLN